MNKSGRIALIVTSITALSTTRRNKIQILAVYSVNLNNRMVLLILSSPYITITPQYPITTHRFPSPSVPNFFVINHRLSTNGSELARKTTGKKVTNTCMVYVSYLYAGGGQGECGFGLLVLPGATPSNDVHLV